MKKLKTAVENSNDYKLQKRLEHFKKKQQEKIKKQQSRLMKKREEALKKVRDEVIIDFEKKKARLLSKQKKIQQRLERKILGKKSLKSLEKKISFAKRFDDLLYLIQKFARLRDTWPDWYWNCITCWKRIHRKEANGWHCITRKNKKTAYLEENINLQCIYCNQHLWWNIWKYIEAIDNKYGKWTYKRLKSIKWPIEVSNEWIEQQKKIYKQKIKELLDNKNMECKSEM